MIRVAPVTFFRVVAPVPSYLRIAIAAAVALGLWTLWLNPGDADAALGSLLLLQMFAVSSGYTGTAARGRFDALLVGRHSRRAIALHHFAAASFPGVAGWLTVAAGEFALGAGPPTMFAPERATALFMISTIAWAFGLAVPRLVAGAAWSVLILAILTSPANYSMLLPLMQNEAHGAVETMVVTMAVVVCPFLLLDAPAAVDGRVVAAAAGIAMLALMAGVAYVERHQAPLGAGVCD